MVRQQTTPAQMKNTKKSDENEEGEDDDDDDDDDASTHNAKCASIPTCDWEGEKCYCLGIRPSMCRRSGCKKFAHQYCQDQWGRRNSVQPYNVSYALCREHHPQYCRFIEEVRDDVADNEKEIIDIGSEAQGKLNNSQNEEDEEEYFDVNDTEEKSNNGDDIDDEIGDPTYKPGSDMLEFDFDAIDENLDSDDESIIAYGKKRKASKSPQKQGKRKSQKHDDGGPERPDVSGLPVEEANSVLSRYRKERKAFTDSLRAKRIHDGDVINAHPPTGVQTTVLRPMAEVSSAHLEVGHSFKDKEVLLLRIAEEANLRGIEVRTARSDGVNIRRTGDNFNVAAVYSELKGWVVTTCDIDNRKELESDDEVIIITKPRSPYNYKMIAALIENTIATKPDTTSVPHPLAVNR